MSENEKMEQGQGSASASEKADKAKKDKKPEKQKKPSIFARIGYENTVKATIEKYVENRGLQDLIHEISIPLETVTEITDNGPKEVERKVFPGYVLVKMVMTDECWHIVRNIRGVTGFLGSGNKPIPLSESDIAALGVEKREIVVGYEVGDSVKITDGALESFLGTVEEIDLDRSKVRVVVSMFGRETPVELELDQVEPVKA